MSANVLAACPAPSSVLFELSVDATPGLLPRLMQPFARCNLVPDRFAARLEGEALEVEIGLSGVPSEGSALIEGNLRRIVGVRRLRRREAA